MLQTFFWLLLLGFWKGWSNACCISEFIGEYVKLRLSKANYILQLNLITYRLGFKLKLAESSSVSSFAFAVGCLFLNHVSGWIVWGSKLYLKLLCSLLHFLFPLCSLFSGVSNRAIDGLIAVYRQRYSFLNALSSSCLDLVQVCLELLHCILEFCQVVLELFQGSLDKTRDLG